MRKGRRIGVDWRQSTVKS